MHKNTVFDKGLPLSEVSRCFQETRLLPEIEFDTQLSLYTKQRLKKVQTTLTDLWCWVGVILSSPGTH